MKTKKLLIFIIIVLFIILFSTTKVEAFTEYMQVFGITETVDISTRLDTDPEVMGEYGIGEPAILKSEFNKLKITELERGKSYYVWDNNSGIVKWDPDNSKYYIDLSNTITSCTLSVNGVKFGTLEQTKNYLWGDLKGDGLIAASILTIDENAVLPTEIVETGNSLNPKCYMLDTSIDGWKFALPSEITLVDKKKDVTITSKDDTVDLAVSGKISENAKLTLNVINENDTVYSTMTDAITTHITNDLDKYNSTTLFVKEIKVENGSFTGNLSLTFDVGTQYNDKKYVIAHKKTSNNEIEYFDGIIKDGKATIEVTELSPFALSILTEKETQPTQPTNPQEQPTKPVDKGEKDTTPKTGSIDILGYVLLGTIIAGFGFIVTKRNLK